MRRPTLKGRKHFWRCRVLLRDLYRAWPPVSDHTVRPDLHDEVIATLSKGQANGKIGLRLRKPAKYGNHT
jgi:hypothetical protein